MSNLQFGQQLRLLREKSGISLNAMARNLQVSSGYLSNLESGKTEKINLSTLQLIPKILGIKMCPVCQQLVPEDTLSDSRYDLGLRINRLHSEMLRMAESDPECLQSLLSLLENGLFHFRNANSNSSEKQDYIQ